MTSKAEALERVRCIATRISEHDAGRTAAVEELEAYKREHPEHFPLMADVIAAEVRPACKACGGNLGMYDVRCSACGVRI